MPVDATQPYDRDNIFARILRGEIPSRRIYEDTWAVAFHDIAAQAPTHVLVIPRGPYVSWDDFSERAPAEEIAGFVRAVGRLRAIMGWSRRVTGCSPMSAAMPGRRSRTSTSICSAASRWGRCWRGKAGSSGECSREEKLFSRGGAEDAEG